MRYWINVVSQDHVQEGIKQGITQSCHGKKAPLARLKKGDWIIHYSPKTSMNGTEKYQKFTSLGQVADDEIYQYDMGCNFVPYRRKIEYSKTHDAAIQPLLDQLSFTHGRTQWGFKFRFGLFEITKEDFELIKHAMTTRG